MDIVHEENGTMSRGMLTMIHTSIGVGLIAMPFAFACLGLIHGLLWSVLSAFMSGFSLYCIAYVGIFLNMRNASFYEVGKAFKLKTFRIIVDLAIALQGWGVCVSYLILIGNALPALIKKFINTAYVDQVFVIFNVKSMNHYWIGPTVVMFTILYPMSLRSIGSLWFMSIIALISICYIVLLVTVYFILYLVESSSLPHAKYEHIPISWFRWSIPNIMQGVPILIFGLTCHQNLFKIFNELASRYKTKSSMALLASSSITIVAFIYSSVAIMGYTTLGDGLIIGSDGGQLFERYERDEIMKHVLLKYDPNHISLSIARAALIILVATAFPLQLHPARDAWGNIYKRCKGWIKKIKDWHDAGRISRPEDMMSEYGDEFNSNELEDDDEHEPLLYRVGGLISTDTLPPEEIEINERIPTNWESLFDWLRKKVSSVFGTFLYCVTALIVSIIVPNFSKILGLVGALGANPIALFFGPYMYVKLCDMVMPREDLGTDSNRIILDTSIQSSGFVPDGSRSWKYFFAIFCMGFSVVLMISVAFHEIITLFMR